MLLNSLVGTEIIESDPPLSINTSLYILVSTFVHFKGSRTDRFYDVIISNLMSPKIQNLKMFSQERMIMDRYFKSQKGYDFFA